ncbi:hypothetical protein THAOC_18899 [Thalassiosira oceanica]|uniref:Uncharacterized protein n=1 Tax=Thalassiosira oceanica TaxID=159749 RepID=K0SQY4_THAOC|nr:hypothetical protein THAOC_18899 [Thalassiosira oceanica]|eukprot:EJK60697.1 hypothetical protein THAOC_18899 [Thalassiosira oceanica]
MPETERADDSAQCCRDKQPPSTPPRGLASPCPTSFFPRTDAEIRSSPRHVIVGTPYARGVEAEQGPPSPDVNAEVSAPISDDAGADSTGYTLKRVTVGGEEYLAETPTVLLADSPQKKRKPRQDGTTKCACGNPECDELSITLQAAGVCVTCHSLPGEPKLVKKGETAGARDRRRRRARTIRALGDGAQR